MVRSLKIIKSEFFTHSINHFFEQASGHTIDEKILYQRAVLLRQMQLYNTCMYLSMTLIAAISLYAMMF
jgi:hypothetical protein